MEATFNVPDVSCEHCKSSIENALAPVVGVRAANVDISSKQVAVEFDDEVTDRATLVRTIESAGYDVAG